jgi:hypothetical protein
VQTRTRVICTSQHVDCHGSSCATLQEDRAVTIIFRLTLVCTSIDLGSLDTKTETSNNFRPSNDILSSLHPPPGRGNDAIRV